MEDFQAKAQHIWEQMEEQRQIKGCGQSALEGLAALFDLSLPEDVVIQGQGYHRGSYVEDRCALLQSALLIAGVWLGRETPSQDRKPIKNGARQLCDAFLDAAGTLFCREVEKEPGAEALCPPQVCRRAFLSLAQALEDIRRREKPETEKMQEKTEQKEWENMVERLEKFKVNPRLRDYAHLLMKEKDWEMGDAARDDRSMPEGVFSQEELEEGYRRGVLNKALQDGKEVFQLGSFHKRIDCCMRGEREYFLSLPEEVRQAIVDYEQDIGLWVVPYRKEGENKAVVWPVPLEQALEIVEQSDARFWVQECDCKVYRSDSSHMRETCLHFLTEENRLNSNFDRGYGRELTREETKELLRAVDRDGLVHNFEGDAFCNCCGCCCWAIRGIEPYRQMGYDVFGEYVKAEYIIAVDGDKCKGCGQCASICPVKALELKEGKIALRQDLCLGCGVCRNKCAFGALSIVKR